MEIKFTTQNFDEEVLKSQTPVLVDFWAEWCGPCHIIAPIIAELANDYEGKLKVGKLNVDEEPGLAQTYTVRSIPTLKIFKQGQIVEEMIGVMSKAELAKRIEKHLT